MERANRSFGCKPDGCTRVAFDALLGLREGILGKFR
jgi:hypothetical protein